MFSMGYLSASDNNVKFDNSLIGDIEFAPKQSLKSTKPIWEEGAKLADKYANKTNTANALATKVDKDGAKVLSTNDFTSVLKSKLEDITTATNIADGDDNYATSSLVFNHVKDKLSVDNNLSDIDPDLARQNLSVQSIATADAKYIKKSNNLSDVDAPTARLNLNVPAVGDSYLKAEVYKKSEVLSKTQIEETYSPILIDTGWMNAENPDNTSQFNIKIRRYGNIVNILGTASKASTNQIWFAVPASIPPPPYSTGQVTDAEARTSAENNRGMSIKCDGDSKNFYVKEQSGAKDIQYVNITYLV